MDPFRKTYFSGILTVMILMTPWAKASSNDKDILVQVENAETAQQLMAEIQNNFTANQKKNDSVTAEMIADRWLRIQGLDEDSELFQRATIQQMVQFIQPNYKISINMPWKIQDRLRIAALQRYQRRNHANQQTPRSVDNPEIPAAPIQTTGADPLVENQWGMSDIGAPEFWQNSQGDPKLIVAVIDTGVDYTHEDLLPNLWRNPKEIENNGIDDDGNGYVDDIIGWDFVSNDHKPYDLSGTQIEIIQGANPGHGTHCAGNVAAAGSNGVGISGVAPKVSIMPIRFISEKGQGTTADAVKAIHYAVKNGAKILSNSWGSEGEDSEDGEGNQALRDAIQFSEEKGVLFIAAAGNGYQGVGYDNDIHEKPAYPASYDHDIIISVAALDSKNKLGSFSNWGKKSVDLAAPGVQVFSTTVNNNYSDIALDYFGFKATWDGTSMAAPHVAGAAALYWSAHPEKTWQDVKAAILKAVVPLAEYEDQLSSGGKLDLKSLMKTRFNGF
ncbi:MAG: S8 family peptidase [Pseudobdellovibrionaceae bacterium]